ncbi:MAG: hypothetical protein AB7S26_21135 [Sandaracinaceae bacterium]
MARISVFHCLWAFTFLVTGCGTSHESDAGPDADCAPMTCGARCGDVDDGCGGTLSCPPCVTCATDADCDTGTVCDLGSGLCTSECRQGPHIAVDLPLVPVEVHVTLNGAPLPTRADASGLSPQLVFVSPLAPSWHGATLDLYARGEAEPYAAPVASLAPGDYSVYLQPEGAPAPWPSDGYLPVGRVSVASTTTSLAIDIPTVEVEVRVTLDGAPVPALGGAGSASTYVELRYEPPLGVVPGRTAIRLTDATAPLHLVFVPGPVTLRFSRGPASPAVWPTSGPLAQRIELGSAPTVAIDIPREELHVHLRRAGAIPADGVVIRATSLEPSYYMPPDEPLGTVVDGELGAYVLPGMLRILSAGGPDGWPQETWTIADREITGPTDVDADLDPVLVRVSADTSPCSGGGEVTIGGVTIPASEEADVWLFRGEHRPTYTTDGFLDCGSNAIAPEQTVPLPPVEIVDDTPVHIDVPMVRAAIRVTLDGDPPAEMPFVTDWTAPILRLRALDALSPIDVPLFDRDLVGSRFTPAETDVMIVAGTYDVSYAGRGALRDAWPNASMTLQESVRIDTDGPLPIALETVAATIDLSVAGGPLPPNPQDSWEGGGWPSQIVLSGPGVSAWSQPLYDLGSDDVLRPLSSVTVPVFRGRYDLLYEMPQGFHVRAEGPLPPPGVPLGCWEP